jgi:hypothetical protein
MDVSLSELRDDVVSAVNTQNREWLIQLLPKFKLKRGINKAADMCYLMNGNRRMWLMFSFIESRDMMDLFLIEERKQKLSHSCFN